MQHGLGKILIIVDARKLWATNDPERLNTPETCTSEHCVRHSTGKLALKVLYRSTVMTVYQWHKVGFETKLTKLNNRTETRLP